MPGERARAASTQIERASEREPAGEGERERDEPGRPARLRQRDGVREADEELRHEHQREHRDRAAEHERAPAPRAASPASGTSASAATATAPVRPGTSAASRKWWTELTTSSPP